jgi:hypothetical protein
MPDVAGDDRQPVLQRGRRNEKIGAAMTYAGAEPSPAAGNRGGDRQDAIGVQLDRTLQPCPQRLGENRVIDPLALDPALDLADGNRRKKEAVRRSAAQSPDNTRMPAALAHLRHNHRIDQIHQSAGSRGAARERSKTPSSCGIASK